MIINKEYIHITNTLVNDKGPEQYIVIWKMFKSKTSIKYKWSGPFQVKRKPWVTHSIQNDDFI